MRYQSKKIFILENGTYQELTYQNYCQKRQNDDSYAERYFIPLQGMLLEVSQDIYSEFYRDKERERYLRLQTLDLTLLYECEDKRFNVFDEELAKEVVNCFS